MINELFVVYRYMYYTTWKKFELMRIHLCTIESCAHVICHYKEMAVQFDYVLF